jgi:hypothetical protein
MEREDEYKRLKVKIKDPAGPRTAYHHIKTNSTQALAEYLYSMTLGLLFPPDPAGRSAVYTAIDGRHFVVTASHNLKRDQVKDILAVPRPQGPIRLVSDPVKSMIPTPKPGQQFQLPIEGMRFEQDPIDLLVIRVKPLPNHGGYLRAYNMSERNPAHLRKGQDVLIIGFPYDYSVTTPKPNNAGFRRRLAMYLHMTERGESSNSLAGYDPDLHLLLNLNSTRLAPIRVDPQGLSGGSVWRMKKISKRSELWSPSSGDLIGIQTGFYKAAKLLKATRIEHAIALARTLF